MKQAILILPFILGSLFTTEAKQAEAPVSFDAFRTIPVLHNGRKMPMDTYAEQVSLQLRGKKPHGEEPIAWLARVIFDPISTQTNNLFVLDNPDIAADASITAEPKHRRYRFIDIEEAIPHLLDRAAEAEEIDSEFRTHLEKETIRFRNAIFYYQLLSQTMSFARDDIYVSPAVQEKIKLDLSKRDNRVSFIELETHPGLRAYGMEMLPKLTNPNAKISEADQEGFQLLKKVQETDEAIGRFPYPLHVVPLDPHADSETWNAPPSAFHEARRLAMRGDPELQTSVTAWADMQRAYSEGNDAAFQAAVDKHLSFTARRLELAKVESGVSKTQMETASTWRMGYWGLALFGSLCAVLIAFVRRKPVQIASWSILVGIFLLSLLPVAVRLYGGTELDGKGVIWLIASLVACLAFGLFFVLRYKGYWRHFGWLIAGTTIFGAIACAVVGKVGYWDLGVLAPVAIESAHNQVRPITVTLWLYILAFLVGFAGMITRKKVVLNSALALIGMGVVFHMLGIEWRMFITARPPVTNLYMTFPFVALGCVLLSLFVERYLKNGVGIVCGTLTGWTLVMMAGMFATDDTMSNVVPVLASQFWLSTHVIAIMFGYMGVFLAGIIAHIYLISVIFKTGKKELKNLYRVMLGVVAFGLVFSFLGTMLGGVWADQSWGRFWGWDPKENGALLIVIWSALTYHARLANLIHDIGVAVMTALGCLVVMWAWLGLNQLGVGLHSYGFTSGLATMLLVYTVVELLLIFGLGAIASFRAPKVPKIAKA